MYSHFTDNSIEEIKNRVDIVEVISEYLNLKKAGANYKGLCPFHNEKTPSFMVSSSKQIFHCFGCGEGGNVFTFIMKYEKISFPESIKMLADKFGIQLQEEKSATNNFNKKDALYKINQITANFFHSILKTSDEAKIARDYLDKRKLNKETTDKFLIGYAPSNVDKLINCFKKEEIQFAIELGIINRDLNVKDKFYFRLKNRLIFPIFDFHGKIAGFGGRILINKDSAKYINSPESIIYNKSNLLFNLNFAKTNVNQSGCLILVEGYIDAIQVYQAGINNVVASLGTALTESHAKLIHRLTDTVIIAYDSDSAGVKATNRGLDILLEQGLQVKIISLPQGMDPDNFVCEKGKDGFLEKINNAQDIFSFKLIQADKTYNKNTAEGKVKITDEILPTIIKTPNIIQKETYIKELAEFLNLDETSIKLELNKRTNILKKSNYKTQEPIKIIEKNGIFKHEELLLHIILENPESIKQILNDFSIDEITNVDIRKIILYIIEHQNTTPKNIISFFQDENISKLVSELAIKSNNFNEKFDLVINDCIKKIRQIKKEQKFKTLLLDLKQAQKGQNKEQELKILKEINDLKNFEK